MEGAVWSVPRTVLRRIQESGAVYTAYLILNRSIPHGTLTLAKMSVREVRLTKAVAKGHDSRNVRWASPKDWNLLRRAGYSDSILERRFASRCRVAVYEEDGEVIGVSWYAPVTEAQWEEYQVSFDFPLTGIWNLDLWVSSDHRGKGIAGTILAFANATLRAEGYRYVYGIIVEMNKNSLRANEKAGSREIGRFVFIRFLFLMFFRTEGRWYLGRFDERKLFRVPLRIRSETKECFDERASPEEFFDRSDSIDDDLEGTG